MRNSTHRRSVLGIVATSLISLLVVQRSDSASAITHSTPDQGKGFSTVNPTQLAVMLNRKNFFFVNVHVPYEGEIAGTDAHIAYDTITENLECFPSEKDAEIVLYCMSDRMSGIAAEQLALRGFSNVSHLSGGMIAWEAGGNKLMN